MRSHCTMHSNLAPPSSDAHTRAYINYHPIYYADPFHVSLFSLQMSTSDFFLKLVLSPGLCSAPDPSDSGPVPSWVQTLKASGLFSLISSLNLSLWLFPLSCSASSCLLLSSSILTAARGSSSCLCANPPARGKGECGDAGQDHGQGLGSFRLFCYLHSEDRGKHTVYYTSNSQIHQSTAPHR